MIGAYRGISWKSKLIIFLSWRLKKYSHVSEIKDATGECIEAWMTGGKHWWSGRVRWNATYHDGHKLGTRIDCYRYVRTTQERQDAVWAAMIAEVGKEYDFAGLWGVIRRKLTENPRKWFCSELVFSAYQKACIFLLVNILPCQVTPPTLVTSPLLEYVGFLIVGQDLEDLGKVPISQIARKNRMIEERDLLSHP